MWCHGTHHRTFQEGSGQLLTDEDRPLSFGFGNMDVMEGPSKSLSVEGVGAEVDGTGLVKGTFSRASLLGSHPGSASCWLCTPGHRLRPLSVSVLFVKWG